MNLGIVVIDGPAGIAPVRKALRIDDPVVRPSGAGEEARVSSHPIEGGISTSGCRRTGACENRKDQKRKNGMAQLAKTNSEAGRDFSFMFVFPFRWSGVNFEGRSGRNRCWRYTFDSFCRRGHVTPAK